MTKPGHKEPLLDNFTPASEEPRADGAQLRIGEEPQMPEKDSFDRRDAQARETTGQIADEVSGMSPTQAARHQNAKFAGHVVGKNIEARAARKAEEEEQLKKENDEKVRKLLSSS